MTLAKLELLEPCLMEAQLAGSGHCMPHHGHGSWSAEERRKVSNFHIVDRSCVRRIQEWWSLAALVGGRVGQKCCWRQNPCENLEILLTRWWNVEGEEEVLTPVQCAPNSTNFSLSPVRFTTPYHLRLLHPHFLSPGHTAKLPLKISLSTFINLQFQLVLVFLILNLHNKSPHLTNVSFGAL